MEETRAHIRKTGKYINWIILLFKLFTIIGMFVGCVIVISEVFFPDEVKDESFEEMFEGFNSTLLSAAANMEGISVRTRITVGGVALFITMLVLFFVIHNVGKLFKEMVTRETPFTDEVAQHLKKTSWAMLVLAVDSVVEAVVLFLLVRLVAYIFAYGAYLQKRADATNRIQEEMILSFAEITENKSGQTGKHIKRVAEYSRILATELGMDAEEAERIRLASTMHDIGKLLVPSEILDKPARLTDEEFAEIKKHTTYGGKLLHNVEGEVMQIAKKIALDHHERPDGRGYPEGKDQESISIEGRIVAVADVYDALTSRRSYKEAWDDKKAYEEIVKGKNTQFDAAVVEAFERAYQKINEARLELKDVS